MRRKANAPGADRGAAEEVLADGLRHDFASHGRKRKAEILAAELVADAYRTIVDPHHDLLRHERPQAGAIFRSLET